MTMLNDAEIHRRIVQDNMVHDYKFESPEGEISSGLSSYGYDGRLSNEFKIFHNLNTAVVDPKDFDPDAFIDKTFDRYCVIPPNSFVLGQTIEYFNIPRDILVICLGKSTYARCGININMTPLEPEWQGKVTLEISNSTPCPAKVYVGEGICQFIFLKAQIVCSRSYVDKKGKYQNQTEVTLPKI